MISGAAGVGKSSTAFEVSAQLQAPGVGHALIDTDELDRVFPVPADLAMLTERNLRCIRDGLRERGVARLVLVGVHLDRPSELAWVARSVPGARFIVVRPVASERTTLERVRRREIGSGLEGQLVRTRRQLAAQPDHRAGVHEVSTEGRTVIDVAEAVVSLTGWLRSRRA